MERQRRVSLRWRKWHGIISHRIVGSSWMGRCTSECWVSVYFLCVEVGGVELTLALRIIINFTRVDRRS